MSSIRTAIRRAGRVCLHGLRARGAHAVSLVASAAVMGLLVAVASAGAARDGEGRERKQSDDRAVGGTKRDRSAGNGAKDRQREQPAGKPGDGGHLLLVPDTRRAQRALERSGARVVVAYGAFDLVAADGRDVERLVQAGADRRDDMREVDLAGGSLDPADDASDAFQPLGENGRALAVVQFVGPIRDRWVKDLRKDGVRVVAYVPQNAYLVSGRVKQLEQLRELAADEDSVVRAVTAYEPSDKVVPAAGRTDTVAVQTLSGGEGDSSRREVRRRGRSLRSATKLGPFETQYLSLARDGDLDEIARQPGVVAVIPYRTPKRRDERASQIVAGNLSGGQPFLGSGYLGWLASKGFATQGAVGIAIDVTDEGLDNGRAPGKHPDLFVNGNPSAGTRIGYLYNYTSDSGKKANQDCGGHGTLNASIAAGFNGINGSSVYEDGGGFNYGLGVAPQVYMGSSKIFRCRDGGFQVNGGLAGLTANAYQAGSRISNNSWGADDAGAYTSDAQLYDALVRDAMFGGSNQPMIEVFAAGNAGPAPGSIGSPATAKNVIAVGASEGVRQSGTDGCDTFDFEADDARQVAAFSSRGPTADGRIKPDLVAPGTHLTGARSQARDYNGSGVCDRSFAGSGTLYSLSSGTSHSTPVVSGAAALVYYYYAVSQGALPSPAMVKAILIDTATDIGASGAGSTEGFGLVDLGRTFDYSTSRTYVDQTKVFTATGQDDTRSFTVADTSKPVTATLVWTDAYAFVYANPALVNDLNLEVVNDGQTFKGNNLPGGVADNRNNVETVVLPAGADGSVDVKVVAQNLTRNAVNLSAPGTDQDFALVVSNVAAS